MKSPPPPPSGDLTSKGFQQPTNLGAPCRKGPPAVSSNLESNRGSSPLPRLPEPCRLSLKLQRSPEPGQCLGPPRRRRPASLTRAFCWRCSAGAWVGGPSSRSLARFSPSRWPRCKQPDEVALSAVPPPHPHSEEVGASKGAPLPRRRLRPARETVAVQRVFPPQPAMDPESSGGILSTQNRPQQPQLLADAGMSPSTSDPLKKFYKGEPLALGITQILIGILLMAFGIMISFIGGSYKPPYMLLRIPCWTGPLFIISGSLSVAAAKNPKIPLVKGTLGVNVASAVAAGIGLLFFATSIDEYLPWVHSWDHGCSNLTLETYKICYEDNVIIWNVESGVMMILLVFTIIELGLAITTAAFGCATVCRDTYNEQVVVIYQNTAQDNTVSFPPAGGDAKTV